LQARGVDFAKFHRMTDAYTFHAGQGPLLISVPHDGRRLPPAIRTLMSDAGKSIPDTDWHVASLYAFAKEIGASIIAASYSRYVVDLNRPANDAALYEGQIATGLCPRKTFDGAAIYSGEVNIDVNDRVRQYWRPYHDKIEATLDRLRATHGYALLWDAHSIASCVPALFDGELPTLNIGTWDGRSCDRSIADAVVQAAEGSPYDVVLNERFKGGYITRHYGQPENNCHAIQLEIAQRAYMEEATTEYDPQKVTRLRDSLRDMLDAFTKTAAGNAVIMRA
jgi:N-formylglutamate amidohydrolase